jgi:Leucine-rich repeat (LRR) protein
MAMFDVSFNQLEAFNVDIRKWKKLIVLKLMYNKIEQYNEHAMWSHPVLTSLDLSDNAGLKMPSADSSFAIEMPYLNYLSMANNSITFSTHFKKKQFPKLTFLILNGNDIVHFPAKSLQSNIIVLGVARCNLKSLPSYLATFQKLKYLDARYNNLTHVDNNLQMFISSNKIESYFAGNELCNKKTDLDCEPLCSKYCWSKNAPNDGFCDVECNSAMCKYDGGDCADL